MWGNKNIKKKNLKSHKRGWERERKGQLLNVYLMWNCCFQHWVSLEKFMKILFSLPNKALFGVSCPEPAFLLMWNPDKTGGLCLFFFFFHLPSLVWNFFWDFQFSLCLCQGGNGLKGQGVIAQEALGFVGGFFVVVLVLGFFYCQFQAFKIFNVTTEAVKNSNLPQQRAKAVENDWKRGFILLFTNISEQ